MPISFCGLDLRYIRMSILLHKNGELQLFYSCESDLNRTSEKKKYKWPLSI